MVEKSASGKNRTHVLTKRVKQISSLLSSFNLVLTDSLTYGSIYQILLYLDGVKAKLCGFKCRKAKTIEIPFDCYNL